MSVTDAEPSPQTPTLADLFIAFAAIALQGFGGVLAWTRRMVVEQRRWMTPDEFNELYSISQVLPGPNIVNFSVVFGRRLRGVPGALAALTGLLGPPILIILGVGVLYARYGEVEEL